MKTIFIGTPEFGAIILEKLAKTDFKPILVITESDKPAGREKFIFSPEVKIIAEKHHIPIEQPVKIKDMESKLKELKPDLIIVAAYGQIIPKSILDIPKQGVLNIHPSLLPKYRGASPIQSAILNGEKETGVTLILMDALMDHGSMVASSKYLVASDDTYESLSRKLAQLGAKLLIGNIPNWVAKKLETRPQKESDATFTKLLKRDDGKINWQDSAEKIERQIRAFAPWPGSFTVFEENGKKSKLKILKASIQQQTSVCPTGTQGKTFFGTNDTIAVQTGENFLIIEALQLEGKKPVSTKDFLMGHNNFIGTILK